ncbi:MAG: tetraacyldisaccharide 4'-kinase [Planctomycetaceae bacterium]
MSRCSLRVLSWLYGLGVRGRNAAFDAGLKRIHHAAAPVVSVGNLTTGGTGKTPFVAFLVEWFRERGVKPAILSRGYRAIDGRENDEKLVLDRLCPGVPHLQHPERVRSARRACTEFAAEVLVLDDGFQHRRLARDLDIVLIDALRPFGYGHLLPRGLLREPLASLRRADLIVLTRVDQCEEREKRLIHECIHALRPEVEIVEIAYPPTSLVNAAGETAGLESLTGRRIGAFCGIGNPEAFRAALLKFGLNVADDGFRTFPDHHHYTPAELDELASRFRRQHLAAVLTTEKDLVKIERNDLAGVPLRAVRIGATIVSRGEELNRALEGLPFRAVPSRREPASGRE